ncbi:hypothetical protein EMCG_01060 [[Emmonsia] crescens]|uniref:Uncharacterized protein n=1 Tax=[Emmonsia] crescens TaxID=73230 RepID=A0A0G2IBC9_9EURO|nr:hypothetical protein EMCG_01060 [Emmonsia crescens UAMH 3008]
MSADVEREIAVDTATVFIRNANAEKIIILQCLFNSVNLTLLTVTETAAVLQSRYLSTNKYVLTISEEEKKVKKY